jgi:hypothetical protein
MKKMLTLFVKVAGLSLIGDPGDRHTSIVIDCGAPIGPAVIPRILEPRIAKIDHIGQWPTLTASTGLARSRSRVR